MPSCFLAPIAPANRVIWTRFDHDAYALNLSIERDSAVLDGHALTKGLFVKNIVQIHEPPSLRTEHPVLHCSIGMWQWTWLLVIWEVSTAADAQIVQAKSMSNIWISFFQETTPFRRRFKRLPVCVLQGAPLLFEMQGIFRRKCEFLWCFRGKFLGLLRKSLDHLGRTFLRSSLLRLVFLPLFLQLSCLLSHVRRKCGSCTILFGMFLRWRPQMVNSGNGNTWTWVHAATPKCLQQK